MPLFYVRIHTLQIDNLACRIGRPPYHRIVVEEGNAEGETGGAAVRAFCKEKGVFPDAGFSFEYIGE